MRAERSFDPYRQWLGLEESQPSDRALLGVAKNAGRDEIDDAYHRRYAQIRQYQVGTHAGDAVRILQELSQAHRRLSARLSAIELEAASDRKEVVVESPDHRDLPDDEGLMVVAFEKEERNKSKRRSKSDSASGIDLIAESTAAPEERRPSRRRRHKTSSGRSSGSSSRSYYIKTLDGRREGPVSRRRLKKYAKYGLIQADTVIWKESWEKPKLASEMFPDLETSAVGVVPSLQLPDAHVDQPRLPKSDSSLAVAVLIAVVSTLVLGLGGYIAWSVSSERKDEPDPNVEYIEKTVRDGRRAAAEASKARDEESASKLAKATKRFEEATQALRAQQAKMSSKAKDVGQRSDVLRVSSSLRFSGWQHVVIPKAAEIVDLHKDFAIELWMRWPLAPGIEQVILGCDTGPQQQSTASGWSLRTSPSGAGFRLEFRAAGEAGPSSFSSIVIPRHGKWRHVAVARHESQLLMFVDGVLVGATETLGKYVPSGQDLFVGSSLPKGPYRLDALVRSVRVSDECRYQKDFKPQWDLPNDDHTLLYLDCTSRVETEWTDRSAAKRHGKLHGVIWISADGGDE